MVAGPMQGSTYVGASPGSKDYGMGSKDFGMASPGSNKDFGMASPGSKDFYVDNLLRNRTLARPVPLSFKARDESPKRTDLKFGVNTILALDSKDKMTPPRELHNPSKFVN